MPRWTVGAGLRRRLLAAALVLLAAAGSAVAAGAPGASSAPITLTDDRGTQVVLPSAPQRIVSLLPSLTETVCVLGACERLVGTDRFSNWPAAVQSLPRLGGLEDVQIEALLRLKPDVVLASRSQRALDRLEVLGVKVIALESQSHADVQRSLRLVATLLGEPARGDQAWAAVQREIEAAATRVPPALKGSRAYFEIGTAPYAAGESSFIGQTLRRLGLANVVPAAMGPFPRLNPEFVVRAQPDVVLVAAREARTLHLRPGWKGLAALRTGRVCGFEGPQWELLVRPGPRLGEAAQAIAGCLAGLPQAAR